MENRDALPRTFVPLAARIVKNDDEAVSRMSTFDFDPRKTVLMTDDLKLPATMHGTASVRYEAPTRTRARNGDANCGPRAALRQLGPGLACGTRRDAVSHLSRGHRAQGFQVPAGKHSIVCVYDPASVRQGLEITGIGGAVLLLVGDWERARESTSPLGCDTDMKPTKNQKTVKAVALPALAMAWPSASRSLAVTCCFAACSSLRRLRSMSRCAASTS